MAGGSVGVAGRFGGRDGIEELRLAVTGADGDGLAGDAIDGSHGVQAGADAVDQDGGFAALLRKHDGPGR